MTLSLCQAIYDSAQWVGSIQDRVFDGTNLKREREALESKFKEQRFSATWRIAPK